ncbi:hypothetical protein DMUE_2253 [Dictyocoela muelleri]|nr:hypothetical protein DMUE_2253 [Dictyocoela muelleri]
MLTPKISSFLNNVLTSRDEYYSNIILTVKNCILYKYENYEWKFADYEGLIVLFNRNDIPTNRLIFFNRKERNEKIWDIKKGFKYKLISLQNQIKTNNFNKDHDENLFIFQSDNDQVYGLFIHDKWEAEKLKDEFDKIKEMFKKSRSFFNSFTINQGD